ncbi:hypothetical protein CYLTODRAFT_257802 [Cylindrobasidium torrendii FP15055 ss-10]|uniref:F-box domain-containing protein n=1 Tax=Cylindrobasidium torrendii FP15055 ss-10 TaxID=1314674 RepID=A0A0D7BSB4_9AGAR|nr:hypothetical protein CYLTODRAFT_257802 [Cylindrobasidium torrendii FP15055 ss-10]
MKMVKPTSNDLAVLISNQVLNRLTHTNEPPSAEEETNVRGMLAAAKSHDQKTNDTASNTVYICERILHPLRRLPPELLRRVFACSINQGYPDAGRETRFRPYPHSLWTLALVCRRWREIIHSSADLWSYIRIDANPELYIFRDHYKASRRAAMHLYHSGTCPLTVHIGSSDKEGRSYGPLNTQLSWILLPCAPRIKTLVLEINTRGISGLDILRGELTGLETLLLSSHAPPELLFLQAIFKECPRLRRVELIRVSVERLEVQLPPSVQHLVMKPTREDTQNPNARLNIPRIALRCFPRNSYSES